MIGEKINETGMTGFVNEKRTRSQWGQWRREKSVYMLKCQVYKCMPVVYLCLRSCICVWACTLTAERYWRVRGSHHVIGEVFQPSHGEYGEQWDDGDVPGYGWDDRDTLVTTVYVSMYTHRRSHMVLIRTMINKLDSWKLWKKIRLIKRQKDEGLYFQTSLNKCNTRTDRLI